MTEFGVLVIISPVQGCLLRWVTWFWAQNQNLLSCLPSLHRVFEEKQLVVFAYGFSVPCSVPGRQQQAVGVSTGYRVCGCPWYMRDCL